MDMLSDCLDKIVFKLKNASLLELGLPHSFGSNPVFQYIQTATKRFSVAHRFLAARRSAESMKYRGNREQNLVRASGGGD